MYSGAGWWSNPEHGTAAELHKGPVGAHLIEVGGVGFSDARTITKAYTPLSLPREQWSLGAGYVKKIRKIPHTGDTESLDRCGS